MRRLFTCWLEPCLHRGLDVARSFGTAARNYNWFRTIEIVALFVAIVALLPALFTFWIERGDRLSERTFRAWEIILEITNQNADRNQQIATGSAAREALEFLNRKFEGRICSPLLLRPISVFLSGHASRDCIIPAKEREILHHLDLPGVDLRGIDLSDGELSRANLNKAIFDGATLNGVNFSSATLSEAKFRSATLVDATFGAAKLVKTVFEYADLRNATVRGADLTRAYFCGSNLTSVDFGAANLQDTDLKAADISHADFEHTRNLTQKQIDLACARPGADPTLPSGLCWSGQTKEEYDECRPRRIGTFHGTLLVMGRECLSEAIIPKIPNLSEIPNLELPEVEPPRLDQP